MNYSEPVANPSSTKPIKTFNDPVHGFISVEDELISHIIELPLFQRLRRITQLGLTNIVYPGANHNRFQHALGATHLMRKAIAVLRSKGIAISDDDERAAKIAILLHDIGHGPFSHALESTIVNGVGHEQISLMVMDGLNRELGGQLTNAIDIYTGRHPVKFLHQLVSSQLDIDRLDYLKRDSFFTGVSEGDIGAERLIQMMAVHNGSLAIEAKGIHSLEQFLLARRLMYWQVYFHKTVVSAEFLLMNILTLARESRVAAHSLNLHYFLTNTDTLSAENSSVWLPRFLALDDFDVVAAVKQWSDGENKVLAYMCRQLTNRRLLKVKPLSKPLSETKIAEMRARLAKQLGWNESEAASLLFQKSLTTKAYDPENEKINVLGKDGTLQDISKAATIFRFSDMETTETKHSLYHPADFAVA